MEGAGKSGLTLAGAGGPAERTPAAPREPHAARLRDPGPPQSQLPPWLQKAPQHTGAPGALMGGTRPLTATHCLLATTR